MSIGVISIIGACIVVGIIIVTILALRRIVPTNQVHIVQRNNKTVSYGKDTANGNVYYEIPSWVPKFGVVVSKLPATIIDISLNHYEAYDKDRLPFVVDVKAFFRITDFAIAASRIPTLEELYDQLTSIVQGAVRSILAKEYLEDIMSKRSEYGELFSKEVEPQLKEWGVMSVKNIELMDIKDAGGEEVISNIMMKKKSAIEMERRVEVAKNTKTAQESEIIAKQEIELKKQDADREVGLRAAAVQQEVGIAQEKQRQEVQAQAKITAEKEMEVKEVNEVRSAEIAKRAAMVKAEQEKEVTIIQVNTAEVAANTEKKN
jgi:flotillin